jgi:glycosyltransferase involved in cell wall biosynthesis
MNFSILLCTKNSQRLIEEVMSSVVNQTLREDILEVIFVDYESYDDTLSLAKSVVEKSGIQFVALSCNKPGKSPALVQGLNAARGNYIVIVDDDNILFPDFIFEAKKKLLTQNVGCLGSMGVFDADLVKPSWFDKYPSEFAIGLPNGGGATDWVWGAGCVVNKEAWTKLTKKSFDFILSPERTSSAEPIAMGGEDVELSLAVNLLGYSVVSSKQLKFFHKFEQKRLTTDFLFANAKGVARSAPVHEVYRLMMNGKTGKLKVFLWRLKVLRKLLGCIKNIIKSAMIGDHFSRRYYGSIFIGIWQGYRIFNPNIDKVIKTVGSLHEK